MLGCNALFGCLRWLALLLQVQQLPLTHHKGLALVLKGLGLIGLVPAPGTGKEGGGGCCCHLLPDCC
jgi:hypothetical protein